jgi:hypothetical protein
VIGQNVNQRIIDTANLLTGKWLLQTSEHGSLKTIQKTIKGDYCELKVESGIVVDTIIKEGFNVIELSFNEYGLGDYQEYSNYQFRKTPSDYIEFEEDQPVPELLIRGNKIFIHLTYLTCEDVEEILELTDNSLILLNTNDYKRTFKRIE